VSQGGEAAVKGTAEHTKKFWDPRMRNAIYAHLDAGGDGLDPPVRQAIEQLKSAS
jgi:formate dehydrogenase subunit delta